ncbi:MAG: trypsin-like peptidase domain-containing protein [Phaeospirillum sp.]|nr:trypsin-like peptidase domain-containing protein [Phaeospirillum sp.]
MRVPPTLSFAAFLMISMPALAGLDEGLAAYQRQDWVAAAKEFRPLATQGNPQAQARLGHMLFQGLGGVRDDVEALKLLNAAGSAGEPLAQHALGNAYFLGRAVPKDPTMALVWYGRAAAQNFGDSIHALGEMHFNGLGVGKDEAKGVEFFRAAADKNIPASLEKLAELSWNGRAMPTDRAKAVGYARRAAESRRPVAQFILGVALLTGDGTAKDPAEAVAWFRRAADQGHPQAQHNLGVTHVTGTGTAKNLAEGYFWLALGADRAPPNLKASYERERDAIGAKLPPAELEQTRSRIAAWKPIQSGTVATTPPRPATSSAPTPSPSPSGAVTNPLPPEQASRSSKTSAGSGFLVSRDGLVLTNAHVVEQCRTITIKMADGPTQVASLAAKDAGNDLALLKTSIRSPDIAKFREDRPLRSGDDVVVVGYPLSSLLSREANVTAGVISAMAGLHGDIRHYQITAPVQKGNSGGPLADTSGNVIGIVSSKLNAMKIAGQTGDLPQNINFAIKAEIARKFMQTYSVAFETGPANTQMSSADVGERIKRVTVFVECKAN